MNLQAFLGSAVIAALVSVIGGVVTKMIVDSRLETVRASLSLALESMKSDLSVWAAFRNDTIREMWKAHREIVAGMTKAILRIQELQPATIGDARDMIGEYRKLVHQHIDMLSPQDVLVCQRFLEVAYSIASGTEPPNDANALKDIRRDFYEQMAAFFHLQEVMPWMANKA